MASLAFRRSIRIAVYVMLLLSAGTTFFASARLWGAAGLGQLPLWAPLMPPVLFTAFVIVYAGDRGLLVLRRGYPPGRAMIQVGLAILFLAMLWPSQAAQLRTAGAQRRAHADADVVGLLLSDKRAQFRAVGCELVGLRGDVAHRSEVLTRIDHDSDEWVRATCRQALVRIDAGSQE